MAIDIYSKTTPQAEYALNDLRYYPITDIHEKVMWFNSIFKTGTDKEGWHIINKFLSYKELYLIRPIDEYTQNNDVFYDIAKQYGWIISSWGIIEGYDINKLTRNKHLLTANELGLL